MRFFPRLAAVAAITACASPPAPAPEPEPPAPAPAAPPPFPPAPPPHPGDQMQICVLRDGQIAIVHADYDPATGDTLVNGRPFSDAYPATSPPYAAGTDWFIRHQPLELGPRRPLMKYGLPRLLAPHEVERVGEYRGLPVFAEAGAGEWPPDVAYILVRPGCEFQPYQVDYILGEVRGG